MLVIQFKDVIIPSTFQHSNFIICFVWTWNVLFWRKNTNCRCENSLLGKHLDLKEVAEVGSGRCYIMTGLPCTVSSVIREW